MKTYLEKLLGFKLLSWVMGKYGVKVQGVHLSGHLVKLFIAEQGTKTLSVFVGGLQEARNALTDREMTIPDMMMVLFFLQGLNSTRYGAIQQDFALNNNSYMNLSLADLQMRASTFRTSTAFFAGSICPTAPSASNARTLRSRLPRPPPPGFQRSEGEAAALIERNISGRDCIFCGDPRHGLLIRPCKKLLERDIVVRRDPEQAARDLANMREGIERSSQDGAAIRASAASLENGYGSIEEGEFQCDRSY